ncbi:regulatory particle non-ATPase [Xylographa carneopallida]|nr:regulatory particle non-ATPase [Xylographa carneopallida]
MSATLTQTSTIPSPQSVLLPTEAQTLRGELKTWENAFAAANHGRKAGREDIKQHPEIAQKYKAYNKLRARLSSGLPPQGSSSPPPPAKKRKRPSPEDRPSSAAQQHTQKLSPSRHHPSAINPYDLPSQLTPNPPRTIIGPTPQKNGLVLGLFDLLSPKPTPSKSNLAAAAQLAGPQPLATPSKNRSHPPSSHPSQNTHSHPPPITTSLTTPTTRRILHQTPTFSRTHAPSPQPDDTPEFLRRSRPLFPSLSASNALSGQSLHGADVPLSWTPAALRLPHKPIGRSLSTLAKDLRDMEEEALDEELALLREIEGEGLGVAGGSANGVGGKAKLLVRDSQVGDMPLGPDGAGEGSSEEEGEGEGEARGRAGKKWKKKGQKRSTRRVVMRPTVGKWVPEKEWVGGVVEEEEGEGEGVVRETQVRDGEVPARGQESLDEDVEEKGKETSKGKMAKPPRKISATAHANFRALKIRNKQSKGKKGGRFGKR